MQVNNASGAVLPEPGVRAAGGGEEPEEPDEETGADRADRADHPLLSRSNRSAPG